MLKLPFCQRVDSGRRESPGQYWGREALFSREVQKINSLQFPLVFHCCGYLRCWYHHQENGYPPMISNSLIRLIRSAVLRPRWSRFLLLRQDPLSKEKTSRSGFRGFIHKPVNNDDLTLMFRNRLCWCRINIGHLDLFKDQARIRLSDLYVYAPIILILGGIIIHEVGAPGLGSCYCRPAPPPPPAYNRNITRCFLNSCKRHRFLLSCKWTDKGPLKNNLVFYAPHLQTIYTSSSI